MDDTPHSPINVKLNRSGFTGLTDTKDNLVQIDRHAAGVQWRFPVNSNRSTRRQTRWHVRVDVGVGAKGVVLVCGDAQTLRRPRE
jgi:hypothetical protein